MSNLEYEELLKYHIERAEKKEYDSLTVEAKLLKKAKEEHELLRQFTNGHT